MNPMEKLLIIFHITFYILYDFILMNVKPQK